jgi:hypothetical protein
VNPSYRKVLIGLTLSSVGLWLVAAGAALTLSLQLLSQATATRWNYDPSPSTIIVVLTTRNLSYVGIGLGALGLLTGFVGRCLCLTVPPAVTSAPARIRMAVIFEACSLLSGTALLGLTLLLARPLPSLVAVTWTLFTGVTVYLARMQFLRFARTLAEHVGPSLRPEVAGVQRLFLYVPCGFLLAFGVVAAERAFASNTLSDDTIQAGVTVFAWLICSAATLFTVFMAWRWSELLVGLRKAVATFVEVPVESEDDPDREYLARYRAAEAGAGS